MINVLKRIDLNAAFSFKKILAINTFLIIGIAIFLPIRFEEIDDVMMMLFSSGAYTGHPESYLVFVNYFYGFFLSGLYNVLPSVEWYSLSFLVLHIVSLSVIIRSIVKKQFNVFLVSSFLVLVFLMELKFLLNLQFTTTAAVTALAGLILISGENLKHRLFGVLLFVLASMVRFEVSILVFLMLSPLFYDALISNGKLIYSRKNNLVVCALILVVSIKFLDFKMYDKSKEWRYYSEYNKVRGTINDNPNTFKIIDNLPAGISNSDYLLFDTGFVDQNTMNLPKLKLISNSLHDVSFASKTANFITQISKYLVLLFVVLFLWSIVFFRFSSRSNKFILLCSLFIFSVILFYITLNGSLKTRVFLSALLPFLYLIYSSITLQKQRFFTIALGAAGVFLLLIFCVLNFRTYNLNTVSKDERFKEQMSLYNSYFATSTKKIILFGVDLEIQKVNPFKLKETFADKLIISGWNTTIPYNEKTFNSYLSLINGYPIFMSKKSESTVLPLLVENIKSHYGINVTNLKIAESDHYIIFQLIKQ